MCARIGVRNCGCVHCTRVHARACLTDVLLADEALGLGGAGVGPEAPQQRLLQVGTEARVVGLPGQPAQAAVGEGRHVLPAPVRHVDLPQAHPGGQRLQGGRHTCLCVRAQRFTFTGIVFLLIIQKLHCSTKLSSKQTGTRTIAQPDTT